MKYSYGMIHNWQPDENPLYRMGREDVIVSGDAELSVIVKNIAANSQLKHENGQPYCFIHDIKIEGLDG